MNGKKTWSIVLKAPALMLLIASFIAGIYAAYAEIQGMGWEVPIILFIVLFLYFLGSRVESKYYKELQSGKVKQKEQTEPFEQEEKELDTF